ncbi:hypothetical protein M9458_050941, partial [Cirrhinus mrigala]
WFGEGSGEIWADVFDCDGNETKLSECSISSWSRAECSHRRDVGVICTDSSLALHDGLVRLSGERQCEGEVEVFIHQVWRRVLLDSLSLTESSSPAPESNLSVFTSLATTTSVSPPQIPSAASLSVPPVLVIVLVVVLLVPLLILIQQNRVMRRALSKRRHRTMTEAVYEEIQHRHNHFTQR